MKLFTLLINLITIAHAIAYKNMKMASKRNKDLPSVLKAMRDATKHDETSVSANRRLRNEKILSKSLRSSKARFTADYDDDNSEFDLSKYSIKFHSCSTVESDDFETYGMDGEEADRVRARFLQEEEDEEAKDEEEKDEEEEDEEEEDEVEEDKEEEENEEEEESDLIQVMNFRLCPTDTCQDDSWEGCDSIYGSYMISLEDYIEAHKEFEQDSLEQFCDYCDQCTYFYENFNAQCEFYDSCSDYETVCESADNDEEGDIDYADFLECTAVDVLETGDDDLSYDSVYLQLICDESLTIGMFTDDQCSNYTNDQSSIYNTTGLAISDDNDWNSYMTDSSCKSCAAMDQQFYHHSYGGNDQDEDDDNILGMCEQLYEESLKCNVNLANDTSSYEGNDNSRCAYMEDVDSGYSFTPSPTTSPTSNFHAYKSTVTNKINQDYLPEGTTVNDVGRFLPLGAFMFFFTVFTCFCYKSKSRQIKKKEQDMDANLVKNEFGETV